MTKPRWVAETFVLLTEDAPRTGYTVKRGDDVIVDLYHDAGWTKKEVRTHARLIAAAPDLLVALREFVADVDAVGVEAVGEDWPDLILTYKCAKAALAKGEA